MSLKGNSTSHLSGRLFKSGVVKHDGTYFPAERLAHLNKYLVLLERNLATSVADIEGGVARVQLARVYSTLGQLNITGSIINILTFQF